MICVGGKKNQAQLPPTISQVLGLGRIVALQKPNGRVRGIVVGDLLRRMVARCLAQTYATPIHQACQPHQFALSTRAGTEAVVHALTAATEQTPDLTILSIDGIGAFDTISRQAMLQGLATVPEANRCIPFVRMFYAQPSAYIWHDNTGAAHTILQAEGGEQGDPLMPALFSLGQQAALQRAQQELQEGEHLFAFLDDVYVLSQPARIRPIYDLLAHHLHAHARIRLNSGKTRIWNAAGSEPPNIQDLGPDVWVGNPGLPRTSQGLVALGAPVGTQEYKQQHLQQTLTQHTELLQAIPTLDDLQASWLLLLFCASPRCNYHLRMLVPEETATFAQDHDTAVAACFTQLLDAGPIPATSLAIAHLPLHMGGLGLSSASVLATPAYWASWADTLPVLAQQAPQLTRSFLLQLQQPSSATPSLHSAIQTAQRLEQHGWQPPTWNAIVEGEPPPTHPTSHLEGPTFQKGWQRRATQACHTAFHNEVDNTLEPPARAMLASQSGPYASRAFTTIPYGPDTSYPPHLFRVILLRRLRLPLPLTSRTCRCRRILDSLGDHRAACAQSGVLRSRAGPLERATARICREAGARVTTNTRVNDLNISHPHQQDDRRIEVIANGLPLWNGAQLAVDTTLVSPLTRDGQPRRRAGRFAGAALQDARRSKERTYPDPLNNQRCRLVVLAIEVGGRWSEEAAAFITNLARARARQAPTILQQSVAAALTARWSATLTHAAMAPFAATLLGEATSNLYNVDTNPVNWSQLLAEAPPDPPSSSRLPPPA